MNVAESVGRAVAFTAHMTVELVGDVRAAMSAKSIGEKAGKTAGFTKKFCGAVREATKTAVADAVLNYRLQMITFKADELARPEGLEGDEHAALSAAYVVSLIEEAAMAEGLKVSAKSSK